MLQLRFTTSSALAVLLLCSPLRMAAQGDTPITVKDGGSLLLDAKGLDAGQTWAVTSSALTHKNPNGMLKSLSITEAGADRCGGDAKCHVDSTKHWTIQINYGAATLTISSKPSSSKGVRIRFPRNAQFPQWTKTANPDERELGRHGDGKKVTGVTVNGGPNLCAGKDGCVVTLVYTTP